MIHLTPAPELIWPAMGFLLTCFVCFVAITLGED